jgi:hypothetical protein
MEWSYADGDRGFGRSQFREGKRDARGVDMARARSSRNGRLEEFMATVLQNQAALQQNIATLVQTQAAFVARMSETDSRIAEMDRRIERRFANIEAILSELVRMIERLPEAVSEKIGFRPAGQQPS